MGADYPADGNILSIADRHGLIHPWIA